MTKEEIERQFSSIEWNSPLNNNQRRAIEELKAHGRDDYGIIHSSIQHFRGFRSCNGNFYYTFYYDGCVLEPQMGKIKKDENGNEYIMLKLILDDKSEIEDVFWGD